MGCLLTKPIDRLQMEYEKKKELEKTVRGSLLLGIQAAALTGWEGKIVATGRYVHLPWGSYKNSPGAVLKAQWQATVLPNGCIQSIDGSDVSLVEADIGKAPPDALWDQRQAAIASGTDEPHGPTGKGSGSKVAPKEDKKVPEMTEEQKKKYEDFKAEAKKKADELKAKIEPPIQQAMTFVGGGAAPLYDGGKRPGTFGCGLEIEVPKDAKKPDGEKIYIGLDLGFSIQSIVAKSEAAKALKDESGLSGDEEGEEPPKKKGPCPCCPGKGGDDEGGGSGKTKMVMDVLAQVVDNAQGAVSEKGCGGTVKVFLSAFGQECYMTLEAKPAACSSDSIVEYYKKDWGDENLAWDFAACGWGDSLKPESGLKAKLIASKLRQVHGVIRQGCDAAMTKNALVSAALAKETINEKPLDVASTWTGMQMVKRIVGKKLKAVVTFDIKEGIAAFADNRAKAIEAMDGKAKKKCMKVYDAKADKNFPGMLKGSIGNFKTATKIAQNDGVGGVLHCDVARGLDMFGWAAVVPKQAKQEPPHEIIRQWLPHQSSATDAGPVALCCCAGKAIDEPFCADGYELGLDYYDYASKGTDMTYKRFILKVEKDVRQLVKDLDKELMEAKPGSAEEKKILDKWPWENTTWMEVDQLIG